MTKQQITTEQHEQAYRLAQSLVDVLATGQDDHDHDKYRYVAFDREDLDGTAFSAHAIAVGLYAAAEYSKQQGLEATAWRQGVFADAIRCVDPECSACKAEHDDHEQD